MFGLSFGELFVLLIVAVVVLGPKELPRYLRKAGQVAGRIRNLAFEMREKSGIDEVLRTEGIDRDIAEIRKLARGEIAGVVSAVRATADAARFGQLHDTRDVVASPYAQPQLPAPPALIVNRSREYPTDGPDSYGALPETAVVYDGGLPPSALVDDAVYTGAEPPSPTARSTPSA